MRYFVVTALLGFVILLTGCSSNTKVTGKVMFEDGTPLTTGEVRFEASGGFLASGRIQPDGTYTMGSLTEKDGVPKGSYKVSVFAMEYPDVKPGADLTKVPSPKSLVAKKFTSGETSGLECKVDGKTTFDIKVEKP
jgi:hypothetical protein